MMIHSQTPRVSASLTTAVVPVWGGLATPSLLGSGRASAGAVDPLSEPESESVRGGAAALAGDGSVRRP